MCVYVCMYGYTSVMAHVWGWEDNFQESVHPVGLRDERQTVGVGGTCLPGRSQVAGLHPHFWTYRDISLNLASAFCCMYRYHDQSMVVLKKKTHFINIRCHRLQVKSLYNERKHTLLIKVWLAMDTFWSVRGCIIWDDYNKNKFKIIFEYYS